MDERPDHRAHDQARGEDRGQAAPEGLVEGKFTPLLQRAGKERSLKPAGNGGGDGNADGAEHNKQEKCQHDIGGHADAGIDHRRLGVLAGEEAGMEHFDQHEGGETWGERGKHGGGRMRIDSAECAALEQDAHDGVCRNEQGDGRRQGQEQRGLERAVLALHRSLVVA